MSKMSKIVVISILVIAMVLLMVLDAGIKSENGIGIPNVLKYLLLFGLVAGIVAVKKKGKEE